MSNDETFMTMALGLARLGLGKTSPNPAVGAVIVKNGKVIARGFHKRAGLAHAEIEALNHLHQEEGATLYVTLEPCCHQGQTPPCTDAILKSGIQEVVIGMKDPDPKVSGRGIKILKKSGIQVRVGVLQKECEKLNAAYIKHRKTRLPFVILKAAVTLDGRVATESGESRWITSETARAFGHEMRNHADAILVGIGTVQKDNPRLTTRLKNRQGRDPVRIILDSSLRISPSARALHVKSNEATWIATTVKPNHPKVPELTHCGAEILFCPKDKKGRVDLKALLRHLGSRDIVSLLVEGGPAVASSFVAQGLADKLVLFMAPILLGHSAKSFLSNFSVKRLKEAKILRHTSCVPVGPDVLFEGYF